MVEQTNDSDDNRPLTPEERRALRHLIAKEVEIVTVATDYAAMGLGARFIKNIALGVSAIIGAIFAWNSYKSGTGFK